MKTFLLLIILVTIGTNLKSQTFQMDSSFGVNGIVKYATTTQGISIYQKFILDRDKNIFVFAGNLAYYFDSSGMERTDIMRQMPDTLYKLRSSITLSRVNNISDSIIFLTLVQSVRLGSDISIRRINKYNLLDSSYGNKGAIFIGFNYNSSYGNCSIDNSYILATSHGEFSNGTYDSKVFKISSEGKMDSMAINFPSYCSEFNDNPYYFTDLVADSKGNFYFGMQYRCYDSLRLYIVKLNSLLELDTAFGNKGYLEIHSALTTNGGSGNLSFISCVVGRNDEVYIVMKMRDPSQILIRKLLRDGTFDSNFGVMGSFQLLTSSYQRDLLHMIYNEIDNELLFFNYDEVESISKLYGLNSLGQLNPIYDLNGGIRIKGLVRDFKPFDENSYLVQLASDIAFDFSSFIVKLKKNLNNSTKDNEKNDFEEFNYKISNKQIKIDNNIGAINKVRILSLLGQEVMSINMVHNSEIVINLNQLLSSVYILEILDNSNKLHSYRILNF